MKDSENDKRLKRKLSNFCETAIFEIENVRVASTVIK